MFLHLTDDIAYIQTEVALLITLILYHKSVMKNSGILKMPILENYCVIILQTTTA